MKLAFCLLLAASLYFAAGNTQAEYLPSSDQLNTIKALLASERGENFLGGRMLWVGKGYVPEDNAVFFLFGDETIRWKLEEWSLQEDETFRIAVYEFSPDLAFFSEHLGMQGAPATFPSWKPIAPERVREKSEKAIALLLTAAHHPFTDDELRDRAHAMYTH